MYPAWTDAHFQRARCYEKTTGKPWKHQARLLKTALTELSMEKRLKWGQDMAALGYTAGWYRGHVIWVDICNTVIPKTKEKASGQALVRKGKKGWLSDDAKEWNRNLRGDPRTTKQGSWGTDRFYWAPTVMRGILDPPNAPK